MILSTFVPFALEGWHFQAVAYAETQSRPAAPLPPVMPWARSATVALDSAVLSETTPNHDAAEDPFLRLARFVPASSPHASAGVPLDAFLAQAYTVRSSRGADVERSVRFYRPTLGKEAAAPDGTAPLDAAEAQTDSLPPESPDPAVHESETLLARGDELLAENRLREAGLTWFSIVDQWPDASASDDLDHVMNALAWDAERGRIDVEELRLFTEQLPGYAACRSDKAVFWVVAAHQITGHALRQQGRAAEARPYLEAGRELARAAMNDLPDSPYQMFFPGHFIACCRDLGRAELEAGMTELDQVVRRQETRNLLKFAARQSLATQYNRAFNDIFEGGVQVMNIVHELRQHTQCSYNKTKKTMYTL